jgi:exoribonuclease R
MHDGHVDRTSVEFVTLDPARSTDLDQAFAIETSASSPDIVLRYAIADVGWFVGHDGTGALDREAWQRGETLYLPDDRALLYPTELTDGVASLLPDVERPAVVLVVRVDADGDAHLDGAERAIVRSRAKLAYETVTDADLPAGFRALSDRIDAAATRRGASRVEPPEQIVEPDERAGSGQRFVVRFRPRNDSELRNASMSLAANLAVAAALQGAGTGLFRVMPEPDVAAVRRLRHTARAFGMRWPDDVDLAAFERTLGGDDPRAVAFAAAVRRAAGGASYRPFVAGSTPWHSAVAATYAHATAPLRRLADRYVLDATLSIANGDPVQAATRDAFARLAPVMGRADARAGQIDRAVIDLLEALSLVDRVGATFDAVVTDVDDRGARVQIAEPAVVARVGAHGVQPGDTVKVELTEVDVAARRVRFERVG